MKRAMSLEEERQALLEQIHSSRAAYRRMLAQYDEPQESRQASHLVTHVHAAPKVRGMPAGFPRSMTMRWVLEHPYAVAGVVAGLVAVAAIGPRRITNTVRRAPGVAPLAQRIKGSWPGAMHREAELERAGFGAPMANAGYSAPRGMVQPRTVVVEKRPSTTGAAIASLAGLATMILRDPAKMRMVARAANAAGQWLKSRRQPAPGGNARLRRSQWQE